MLVKVIQSYLIFWGLWEVLYNFSDLDGTIIRILTSAMRLTAPAALIYWMVWS